MKQRTIAIVGLLMALLLGLFVVKGGRLNKPAAAEVTTKIAPPVTAKAQVEAPAALPAASAPAPVGSALAALLGSGEVPALPDGAPKQVSFGVVLFSYTGTQGAAAQAPSKAVALERAQAALTQATTDFAVAVKLGDSGSVANAGRISRGILEPSLEYVLFTLKKGEVFPEPLDTPRGYWILRRVD